MIGVRGGQGAQMVPQFRFFRIIVLCVLEEFTDVAGKLRPTIPDATIGRRDLIVSLDVDCGERRQLSTTRLTGNQTTSDGITRPATMG